MPIVVPMVDLRLDPMSAVEFEAFKEQAIKNYADENVRAGYWHSSEANRRSIESYQKLLPDGIATEGHHIFIARDVPSEEAVGYIWLSVEKDTVIPSGFIFVVFVYKQFRGRGYGTMMMKAIEAKASDLGLKRLMLHTFAQNPVAIHLYEGIGYSITSLNMMREIPQK
jgi:ribosomal protein S18 acetylase RimI-like enzyme